MMCVVGTQHLHNGFCSCKSFRLCRKFADCDSFPPDRPLQLPQPPTVSISQMPSQYHTCQSIKILEVKVIPTEVKKTEQMRQTPGATFDTSLLHEAASQKKRRQESGTSRVVAQEWLRSIEKAVVRTETPRWVEALAKENRERSSPAQKTCERNRTTVSNPASLYGRQQDENGREPLRVSRLQPELPTPDSASVFRAP
ncbi:unnamed protein product [Ixodes pacificus]